MLETRLKQPCIMKWRSSATCRELKNRWLQEAIQLQVESKELYVSPCLFTNAQLLYLLNSLPLLNSESDSYLIINEHNPSLPVHYNPLEQQYRIQPGFEDHPVVGISWTGAAFVAWLLQGRLLLEREWECCATSGNKDYRFPWGNESPSADRANYGELIGRTTPVKSYPPNEWGLYDMAGNAEEWCLDNYHPEHREIGLAAFDQAASTEKTVKGGSWNKGEAWLSPRARRGKWYKIGTVGIGFRVVWDCMEGGDGEWFHV